MAPFWASTAPKLRLRCGSGFAFNFNSGPAFQSNADPDPDPAPKMMRSGILDPVPMFFVYGPGGVYFLKVIAVDCRKKKGTNLFRSDGIACIRIRTAINCWIAIQNRTETRARICKPFKEPRNRCLAWRNRFLWIDPGLLKLLQFGLGTNFKFIGVELILRSFQPENYYWFCTVPFTKAKKFRYRVGTGLVHTKPFAQQMK